MIGEYFFKWAEYTENQDKGIFDNDLRWDIMVIKYLWRLITIQVVYENVSYIFWGLRSGTKTNLAQVFHWMAGIQNVINWVKCIIHIPRLWICTTALPERLRIYTVYEHVRVILRYFCNLHYVMMMLTLDTMSPFLHSNQGGRWEAFWVLRV